MVKTSQQDAGFVRFIDIMKQAIVENAANSPELFSQNSKSWSRSLCRVVMH